MDDDPDNQSAAAAPDFSDDLDSCCSTPYASAPSSPGRPVAGFYYSAPASPTHFVISTASPTHFVISTASLPSAAPEASTSSFEFDFPATFPPAGASSSESMSSADELFCNGQIRPMKLPSSHPRLLAPLVESDAVAAAEEEDDDDERAFSRGRDSKLRAGSLRRRTRSMSPHRTTSFEEQSEGILLSARSNLEKDEAEEEKAGGNETTPRSSSSGRSSRRWVFLKEFLYRSKSEGRRSEGYNGKFWGSLSFSPVKDSRKATAPLSSSSSRSKVSEEGKKRAVNNSNSNKNGKRRVGPPASAHELHYTANRAQAEEMRKRTFLPYRQGLLGCLGFTSKSYGAINGFARALNPVSSR